MMRFEAKKKDRRGVSEQVDWTTLDLSWAATPLSWLEQEDLFTTLESREKLVHVWPSVKQVQIPQQPDAQASQLLVKYKPERTSKKCRRGGLWAVTQISRPCHFAIGWRTERIIRFQCSSSELLSLPTVNCPIRCLVDFLVVWVSYTETIILHRSRGNSGRENMNTSLKAVTRQRATTEVFWYLNLHLLHWTLILAYRAVQHKEGKLVTVCYTVCVWQLVTSFLWRCLLFTCIWAYLSEDCSDL